MRRRSLPRRGVALLAALVAIAIVAALLTAAFFSALETDRSALLLEHQAQVRAAAERALIVALSQWNTPARVAQEVGAPTFVPPALRIAQSETKVWATRISARTFWLVAKASDDLDSTTTASAGMLVRLDAPRFPRLAALVSRGSVRFDGSASVRGDVAPGPNPCDSAAMSLDAIVVPPGAVTPSNARVLAIANADSLYTQRAPVDLAALAAGLGATVPAGSSVVPGFAPLLYALGDLTLNPGTGSGIVIAQGRIRLMGPIQFSGVLVGMGGVEVIAGHANIVGIVMSGWSGDSSVVVSASGALDLRFSECVVEGAELATAVARPARERAMVRLP